MTLDLTLTFLLKKNDLSKYLDFAAQGSWEKLFNHHQFYSIGIFPEKVSPCDVAELLLIKLTNDNIRMAQNYILISHFLFTHNILVFRIL